MCLFDTSVSNIKHGCTHDFYLMKCFTAGDFNWASANIGIPRITLLTMSKAPILVVKLNPRWPPLNIAIEKETSISV